MDANHIKQRIKELLEGNSFDGNRPLYLKTRGVLQDCRALIEEMERDLFVSHGTKVRQLQDDKRQLQQRIEELEGQKAEVLHNHLHAFNPLVEKLTRERNELKEELDKANAALGCGEEGWLAPNEAERLKQQLRQSEAQREVMRKFISDWVLPFDTWQGPRDSNPKAEQERLKALSSTAGTSLLAELERYRKALEKIASPLHNYNPNVIHGIAQQALKGQSKE